MALNLLLVFPLAHARLALATTLSSWLNAYLLYSALIKQGIYRPESGWPLLMLRITLSALAMGVMLWWGAGAVVEWLEATAWDRIWRLAGLIAVAMLLYFSLFFVLGGRLHHFRSTKG
jgi:putative peptidoglycan lipid II flippase